MKKIRWIKEQYINMPIALKASMWFFICIMIQKMIGVISTMIFTRILTASDYGYVSVYGSWQEILYVFATLNLSTGIFNVGMAQNDEYQEEYTFSLQVLASILASIFLFAYVIFFPYLSMVIQLPLNIVLPMLVMFIVSPGYKLWVAKQRFTMKYRMLLVITIFEGILTLFISVFAVKMFDDKEYAKIMAGILVSIGISSFVSIGNGIKAKFRLNVNYWKTAFVYNIQMLPAFISIILFNQIDRVMINNMVGSDKAGIYSVAYNAALFITAVSTALNMTFNPWLMKKIHERNFLQTGKLANTLSMLFIVCLSVFIMLAPDFIKLLASYEYYEAIYVVPPVAGSVYFTILYTFYSPFIQYFMKPKILSLINIVIALLNIVLNYYMIQQFGFVAAGYTTFICYIVYGWGAVIYGNYIMKTNGIYNVYNIWRFLAHTVILTIVVVCVNYLYRVDTVRYLFVFIIAALVLFFKDKILELIRGMRYGHE